MNTISSHIPGRASDAQAAQEEFKVGENFGGDDGFWDSKLGNDVDEKENEQIIKHLGIENFSKEMQEEILGMLSDMMVNSNQGLKAYQT